MCLTNYVAQPMPSVNRSRSFLTNLVITLTISYPSSLRKLQIINGDRVDVH